MTAAANVPAPRGSGRYRIAVVCLGNICRSPIGEVVLTDRVESAGFADAVEVRSFGTGGWHVGERMDRRSAAVLSDAGYDPSAHRGEQVTPEVVDAYDLVLGMDADNVADLARIGSGASERLHRFRDFDPAGPGDVADPYYGGADGFTTTLQIVERTADALVADLARVLDQPRAAR